MDAALSARILIIEDEILTVKSIAKSLVHFGHQVAGFATNYSDGIAKVIELEPDLVLMDIKLSSDKDGIDLAKRIQAEYDIPIVFLSAHSDVKTINRVYDIKPDGYLVKPYADQELYSAIRIAMNRRRS